MWLPLRMQLLDLKVTDVWSFLAVPGWLLDDWEIVAAAMSDWRELQREQAADA